DANGQATVTVNSPTTGKDTCSAASTLNINGASITVSTNGQGGNSGPATKTWVDARITITPASAINPVTATHTLTGHVDVDLGDGAGFVSAPAGTSISFAIASGPGTLGTPNPCTTAGNTGSCTITLTSATPGTTVVNASTTVSVGGVSLTRTTNGGANS